MFPKRSLQKRCTHSAAAQKQNHLFVQVVLSFMTVLRAFDVFAGDRVDHDLVAVERQIRLLRLVERRRKALQN